MGFEGKISENLQPDRFVLMQNPEVLLIFEFQKRLQLRGKPAKYVREALAPEKLLRDNNFILFDMPEEQRVSFIERINNWLKEFNSKDDELLKALQPFLIEKVGAPRDTWSRKVGNFGTSLQKNAKRLKQHSKNMKMRSRQRWIVMRKISLLQQNCLKDS